MLRTVDDRTVVRLGIKSGDVADGGVSNKSGTVSFTLSQIRLICVKNGQSISSSSDVKVIYPERYLLPRKKVKKDTSLDEIIEIPREMFKKRIAWIDLAFNVPGSMKPALLEFKQNSVIELPQTVDGSDEIERQLNSGK